MPDQHSLLIELHSAPGTFWWALVISYPTILIEAYENYQKRSCRNRIYLAGPQGSEVVSIPLLKGKNNQKPIQQVLLANDYPWKKVFLRQLKNCYRSAAFFEEFYPDLETLCQKEHSTLWDWNLDLLSCIQQMLNIYPNFLWTDQYVKQPASRIRDARNLIGLGGHASVKTPQGIHVINYPQVFLNRTEFQVNMSIFDLLFCHGRESLEILQKMSASSMDAT